MVGTLPVAQCTCYCSENNKSMFWGEQYEGIDISIYSKYIYAV